MKSLKEYILKALENGFSLDNLQGLSNFIDLLMLSDAQPYCATDAEVENTIWSTILFSTKESNYYHADFKNTKEAIIEFLEKTIKGEIE